MITINLLKKNSHGLLVTQCGRGAGHCLYIFMFDNIISLNQSEDQVLFKISDNFINIISQGKSCDVIEDSTLSVA